MLALNLVRQSVPVEVLETKDEVDASLRAALHSAPGVQEVTSVGRRDDVRERRIYSAKDLPAELCHTTIASLDGNDLPQGHLDR